MIKTTEYEVRHTYPFRLSGFILQCYLTKSTIDCRRFVLNLWIQAKFVVKTIVVEFRRFVLSVCSGG